MPELSTEVNPAIAARLGRPRTVLDLGCGAGVNGMVAQRAGARVTGIEHRAGLFERAQLVLSEVLRVDPLDSAAVEQALGERRFDLVLIPTALEQASDPGALVARAARWLEPGGRVMYAVRNHSAWPLRLGLKPASLGFGSIAGAPARYFSSEQANDWARQAGLQVLELSLNPLLLKALRSVVEENVYTTLRHDERVATGFRDWPVYEAYAKTVLPLERKAAELLPAWLAYQHVVVARKAPPLGPLSLTVGMLTMDEEPSIARMMEELRRYAPDAKILCVDSSVRDQTPFIAERLGARVLRQLPPRGHGPAMELLMYEAAGQSDALIYLDCDFTYPAHYVPKIRAILEDGADVVNAARTRERPEAMPLMNYMANKTFAWCAQALNGLPVSDLHSGMRGYRSSVIRDFSFDGSGDALPIDTLLWPARSGYRVVEIPIEYKERVGVSKLRRLTGTLWTFIRLGRTLEVGSRGNGQYELWQAGAGGDEPRS